MRSSLRSLRRRAPYLVPLAFLVACQDAPVAPHLRPRAASADVSAASTFVVINTANDGVGSLRQALANADASAGADVITFAIPGTDPGCSGGTCTIALDHLLDIQSEVTIDGTGSTIILSGNDVDFVLLTWPGTTVSLKALTLEDGVSGPSGYPGGCINSYGTLRLDHVTVQHCTADAIEGMGGGIYSEGSLELEESVVADNSAHYGGGIFSSGPLTINKSSIERNRAVSVGGLWIYPQCDFFSCTPTTATITDSRIVDNAEALPDGFSSRTGGITIFWNTTVTMLRTLVSGNSSSQVGGIRNAGNLTVINSTITGNVGSDVGSVGGLLNGGSMQLSHVTIAGNVGAVTAIDKGSAVGAFRMSQSIVDGGAGPACAGAGTDDGYNIDRGTTCGFVAVTSRSNTDPMLGPLADNGGTSLTHALLLGSPAFNAIPVGPRPLSWLPGNGCGAVGETDQRGAGFARLSGVGCDIGAYERQVPPTPVFSGFLAPVKAGVVNQMNAGRVLPVNFTLGGDFGLTPFVTGYPMVTVTPCPAASVARYKIALSSTTTGVKASKLNYNVLTGQYTYLWVTDKSWAGSCRRLTFQFAGENVAYSLDVEFVR